MSIDILKMAGINRLPLIRQGEAAECGLACLAMIAGYYGYKTSLTTLRRRFNTTLRGMTLKDMMETADDLGLSSRALKIPLAAIGKTELPVIIHWNLDHFVVLKSVTRSGYTIHDPAIGERVVNAEEFTKSYTGIILELRPNKNFEKKSEKISMRITDLWGSITGLKRGLIQLVILSVLIQTFVLVSPFFLQIVVDQVLSKSDAELLTVVAIGFGGIAIIHALTQLLRDFLVLQVGAAISFQIASNLFSHLLSLPIDYFERRHMGDIVSRFNSVTPIKIMLTEGIIGAIIDGLMAITTLAMMYVYSPLLGMTSTITWLSYFFIRTLFYKRFRKHQETAITSKASESSTFMESINHVVSLKLFGGEKNRVRLWQNLHADSIHYDVKVQKFQAWFQASTTGLQGLELVVLVALAANMVLQGEFTVGMLFAFIAYRTSFSSRVSILIERFIEFKLLGLHLDRIADIAHSEPEGVEQKITNVKRPIIGKLELKNVSYRYSPREPLVLDRASATIEAGESIAIVGETGCGKSTLLKIMVTLFRPGDGEFLVDNVSIDHFGVSEYRNQVAVVMQDDELFSGSLIENISFFDPNPNMEEIEKVCRQASIYDDIIKMPMQFNSVIGERGGALSGGQKQRLTIARALYRKPKILFMDEGTSDLDVDTEVKVNEAIKLLGITRVIVAHRPDTIRSTDRVLMLRDHKLIDVTGNNKQPDTAA